MTWSAKVSSSPPWGWSVRSAGTVATAGKVARRGDGEQILARTYTPGVHPIERLRFVARSQGAPTDLLVREAAGALGAFRDDPAGMVAACRRIIDRQLSCAPLWWLCARMLCAPEPMAEARAAVDELAEDMTARLLAAALPDDATVVVVGWPEQSFGALRRRGDLQVLVVDVDGEAETVVDQLDSVGVMAEPVAARNVAAAVRAADVVLLDALAVGPEQTLVASGSFAASAAAAQLEVPVWLVAGAGRLMPASMFTALQTRWSAGVDELDAAEELMALAQVDAVAGSDGVTDVPTALRGTDCPVAPELFRLAG